MNRSLDVYTAPTCEDSALILDHLRALGIPFTVHDRERERGVNELLARWNHGALTTPTLKFSEGEDVLAEPSLEALDARLRAAGFDVENPRAVEVRGERKNQRLPNFTLPTTDGTPVTLYQLRGRKRPVLFFGHTASERICQGYARQLTNHRELLEEYNALPLLILPDELEAARGWAEEFARGYPALSDADRRVRAMYYAALEIPVDHVAVIILDSFCAPRAYSAAPDAGALIVPSEITSWLRLLDCECDE